MTKLRDDWKQKIHDAFRAYGGSGIPERDLLDMCAKHAIGLLELDSGVTAEWYEPLPQEKEEESEKEPAPVIGTPAAYSVGSDTYPVTIISVSPGGRKITVQDAKATRTSGNAHTEEQSYTFEPDPNGSLRVFTLRPNGRYYGAGGKHSPLNIGAYDKYRDPSF